MPEALENNQPVQDEISGLSLMNSLTLLAGNIAGYGQQQISQTETLRVSNRNYMISNDRTLLAQSYVEHGIIQALIDQPVDDAFRAGFDIKTGQLSPDELRVLRTFMERNRVTEAVMQAMKWARLFGGGAVIPITGQNPSSKLNVQSIKEGQPLTFRSVDLWELNYSNLNNSEGLPIDPEYYQLYSVRLHSSRVFRINGKEAPSWERPRLRGWGMSEVERLVRSLNQYLKNQTVIFELLDEAKVDIYKMQGFNSALLTIQGTEGVSKRIQHANTIKNYQNALTMDKDDEYEQKQFNFTGLAEMLTQIRQGIAADLRMPMTKLFGISASGFNSGEDDIENYNGMIESEIRAKVKYVLLDVIAICCQHLFGVTPEDLDIHWNPLRIMSAEQEEKVKLDKFSRVMQAYQAGLIDAKETKEAINKAALLPVEVDASREALPPLDVAFAGQQEKQDNNNKKKGKQDGA